MCLAIPMQITAVEGDTATIELGGVTRRASLMLVPGADVGDYVLVHAGCAITVLDEREAQERLELFAELEECDPEADEP